MTYTLDLYASGVRGDTLAHHFIKRALRENSDREWSGNDADRCMAEFDTDAVIYELTSLLGAQDSKDRLALIRSWKTPCHRRDVVTLITSHARAGEVISLVFPIVLRHKLILFDRQNAGKVWHSADLLNATYCIALERHKQIIQRIHNCGLPLWRVRAIEEDLRFPFKRISTLVVVRKSAGALLDCAAFFHRRITEVLAVGEELVWENRCLHVRGASYELIYCFEGFKRHCDQVFYLEGGVSKKALLRRQDTLGALAVFDSYPEQERADIFAQMLFEELHEIYPNPADRFVYCVKMTKQLQKMPFGIRLSDVASGYSAEVIFHLSGDVPFVSEGILTRISCLKIEEESASFLLPMINDIYPYVYKRYYLDENQLPFEMWYDIAKQIRYISDLIVNDTYNPELAPYIQRFNLFALATTEAGKAALRENESAFLHSHRYEVKQFYDFFLDWLDKQFRFQSTWNQINVQGP